mmetsp:Transcript_12816/g.51490  ORF Transcript_12816/g.51490 Transcript_12816/m.51490 type:complete len:525 (-) Transcript_12816:2104-3678(-)
MLKESVFQEWCFFLWTRLVLLVHFSRVAAVGESPGPARFRFPAIVRAVGYMVHLSSSLSRRFEFFFFSRSRVSKTSRPSSRARAGAHRRRRARLLPRADRADEPRDPSPCGKLAGVGGRGGTRSIARLGARRVAEGGAPLGGGERRRRLSLGVRRDVRLSPLVAARIFDEPRPLAQHEHQERLRPRVRLERGPSVAHELLDRARSPERQRGVVREIHRVRQFRGTLDADALDRGGGAIGARQRGVEGVLDPLRRLDRALAILAKAFRCLRRILFLRAEGFWLRHRRAAAGLRRGGGPTGYPRRRPRRAPRRRARGPRRAVAAAAAAGRSRRVGHVGQPDVSRVPAAAPRVTRVRRLRLRRLFRDGLRELVPLPERRQRHERHGERVEPLAAVPTLHGDVSQDRRGAFEHGDALRGGGEALFPGRRRGGGGAMRAHARERRRRRDRRPQGRLRVPKLRRRRRGRRVPGGTRRTGRGSQGRRRRRRPERLSSHRGRGSDGVDRRARRRRRRVCAEWAKRRRERTRG